MIEIDIHPEWFQCLMKGKMILLHLPVEVVSSRATVQRVTTTGALVLKMPRVSTLPSRRKLSSKLVVAGNDGPRAKPVVDVRNIVANRRIEQQKESIDDSDVPPLE